jgi:hypothetical protein
MNRRRKPDIKEKRGIYAKTEIYTGDHEFYTQKPEML